MLFAQSVKASTSDLQSSWQAVRKTTHNFFIREIGVIADIGRAFVNFFLNLFNLGVAFPLRECAKRLRRQQER